MNRCGVTKKAFVLKSLTSSKCTALVAIQTKTAIYVFTFDDFWLKDWGTYTGPQKSRLVFENGFEGVTLALDVDQCQD